ncbi:FtsQ-type POTRA domain-containing protein [Deinococcus radiomollis]|uniref:cell division protein FtsQ/DivIB n=1 Tax=Deinococcus radiomollis TaxID=468916 RepID=UPI003891FC25
MSTGPAAVQEMEASRRSPGRFWLGLLSAVLVVGALAALWFLLPIRAVTVSGNRHLSATQVETLAGLTPPFFGVKRPGGWLFYGGWRAAGLRASPWLLDVQVLRRFPGKVEIQVTERVPAARWQTPDGKVVTIAWDGTVLPGATLTGPLLVGWGPDRLPLARTVAKAFERYTVESVRYTPSGLTIQTQAGTVWSGNLNSLLKYSGSVKMFAGKHMNIYPWGVSVQQ